MSAGPYSIGSDVVPGLAKAMEEAGEFIQVAGKIIAAGGMGEHWDGSDLRTRLAEEAADLYAALDFLAGQNGLTDAFTHERRGHKLALFTDWHSHNRDGSLNRDAAPLLGDRPDREHWHAGAS